MSGNGWLLGGGYPWRSATVDVDATSPFALVVANEHLGLSLSALRTGPVGLESADGSLGQLTLPIGVALEDETLLTLPTAGDRVLRYDPVSMTLGTLAAIGAGNEHLSIAADIPEPRQFRGAANITLSNGWLYVADVKGHRVQVFDLQTGALVRLHAGFTGSIDVCAGPAGACMLDGSAGRVLLDHPKFPVPRLVVDAPYRAGRWDRVAVDRSDRIYLRDSVSSPPALDVFDTPRQGRPARPLGRVASSDQVRDRFEPPRVRTDGRGTLLVAQAILDPCDLRRPLDPGSSSWQVRHLRYVLERASRTVTVFFNDGRRRHCFGPFDGAGNITSADAADSWRPTDGAALDTRMFILDARYRVVYEHRPGEDSLRVRFRAPSDLPRMWTRMVAGDAGCLLLWDGSDIVDRLDPLRGLVGTVSRQSVLQRFRTDPVPEPLRSVPSLTRDGVQPAVTSPQWPTLVFESHGIWLSEWLDSDVYDCQWDTMRLRVPALPPGSRLAVRTRTRADASSLAVLTGDAALGNAASWQQSPIIVADPQPDPAQKPKPNTEPDPIELLVLSRPGQFLQLQIEMWGDGVRTPVIESVRLTAPRDSWVQYLPAIFSQPEEQRIFLDRYLSTAQATWNRVEDALGSFARFLDPRSVPADQLAYLAGWLDLQLEGSLKPDQNRQILAMLPHIRREWGTVEGMRKWIRVHLAVLSGLDINVLERSDLPGIVERFVERRRFLLGRDDLSRLSGDEPLWSPAVERRFQLDVFDQEGEVELVSTGEPDLDLFRRYAHSFRVFIPASWVRTAATEALLRRAIDLQRPAHTIFDLVLVEPRFAIGFQSTLDLDAVVGGDERWQLASDREPVREGRAPYSRLGFDTTIHGSYLGCLGSDGRLA